MCSKHTDAGARGSDMAIPSWQRERDDEIVSYKEVAPPPARAYAQ
eukprot:CAMPEP_0183353430 /NCGR_PEP_ID=MMETSP0164_2-20130417/33252_1 /TAXON_ID=221442 /ORGANISM="Coccolithus pelagicus ssp braarudi, Strain PLY182g" /LENGTH=44 /DNA_ID= /DNA_START= /DNA_END= /DNA_ORIENTATION=